MAEKKSAREGEHCGLIPSCLTVNQNYQEFLRIVKEVTCCILLNNQLLMPGVANKPGNRPVHGLVSIITQRNPGLLVS